MASFPLSSISNVFLVTSVALGFCSWYSHGHQKMIPYWRNFQSLILLINFFQFLLLILVNRFTFSSVTLKKCYLSFIYCIFYSILLPFIVICAVLTLNFTSYILKTNVLVENKYFYYIIIANMQNICFLIGWNSVHISDIFDCYSADVNGMWNAKKRGGMYKTFEFILT